MRRAWRRNLREISMGHPIFQSFELDGHNVPFGTQDIKTETPVGMRPGSLTQVAGTGSVFSSDRAWGGGGSVFEKAFLLQWTMHRIRKSRIESGLSRFSSLSPRSDGAAVGVGPLDRQWLEDP